MKITTAPGKIVIAGEYAVREGYPALVMATKEQVICTSRDADRICISGNLLGPFDVVIKDGLVRIPGDKTNFFALAAFVLEEALKRNIAIPKAHFHIDSSQLYVNVARQSKKMGLGSSAAIAVALAKQLSDNEDIVFAIAYAAHERFTGKKGSGIDVAAACYGGLLRFQRTPALSIVKLEVRNLEPYLSVVYTGQSQNTHNFLLAVDTFKDNQPAKYKALMAQIGDIVEQLEHILHQGDIKTNWNAWCHLIDRHRELLKELGELACIPIVPKEHEWIAEDAHQKNGAAKPSGAGGGDVWVRFA